MKLEDLMTDTGFQKYSIDKTIEALKLIPIKNISF